MSATERRERGEEDFGTIIKLVLVGNVVGKSNVLLRYTHSQFSPALRPTVIVDFALKTVAIGRKKIKLQIWDTGGGYTFIRQHCRGAQGVLIFFDVTDRASFESIERWKKEADAHADSHVDMFLVGNKCDLESSRVISCAEGETLARILGMKYFEMSAKTGEGVEAAFHHITHQIVDRLSTASESGIVNNAVAFTESVHQEYALEGSAAVYPAVHAAVASDAVRSVHAATTIHVEQCSRYAARRVEEPGLQWIELVSLPRMHAVAALRDVVHSSA